VALIVYVPVGILQFTTQIPALVSGQHAIRAIGALQRRDLALLAVQPARFMLGQAAVADTLPDLRLLPVLLAIDAAGAAAMPPVAPAMPATLVTVEAAAMPPVTTVMVGARLVNVAAVLVKVALHLAALAARKMTI
jgi:hypothetical protein